MKDPIVSNFAASATALVDKFVTELEKDSEKCAAVMLFAVGGGRTHIGMTTGGGHVVIALEMIGPNGQRLEVGKIEAQMSPDELDQLRIH